MMHDIASMGGELFVMDDGWFGDKYPRKTDNSSLGDWVVDQNKLPDGIEGLLRDAKKNGVKFGIWIEPEMANTVSELNRIDYNPLYCEGKSYSGHYLMTVGLEMPARHSTSYSGQHDWASRVLLLEAQ